MNREIIITLSGDALVLFEDFLKYAEICSEEMADVMMYCGDAFDSRLRFLKKAYDNRKVIEARGQIHDR